MSSVPDGYEFAVCLTHDVDRVHKSYQYLYNFLVEGDSTQLAKLFNSERPYWQFDRIMAIEESLDVRSTWFFLNEQHLIRDKPVQEWLSPTNWKLFMGRYDIRNDKISQIITELDENGWEIGLHGSYESFTDYKRLRKEKETLEDILGKPVEGGRQHYLNLDTPETWKHHRDISLSYDASLETRPDTPFEHGYDVVRPFDDSFVVFPLTAMEVDLYNKETSLQEASTVVDDILAEADENNAVTTFLWHPRFFYEGEYSGYTELYERLVTKARDMGAWIGPCGELYSLL